MELKKLYKIIKIFFIIILLSSASYFNVALSKTTTTQPKKKTVQKHPIKKTTHLHPKKNLHHPIKHTLPAKHSVNHHHTKTIAKTVNHTATQKSSKKISAHLHNENEIDETVENTQSASTAYQAPTPFYRILTQPMTSLPKSSETRSSLFQATPQPASAMSLSDINPNTQSTSPSFATSLEQRLVNFVQKSVETLRYSKYRLGGMHIDSSQGIYIVDCSGYVDHTLRAVYPNAYFNLVDWTGADKPNSSNYYDFFTNLNGSTQPQYWSKIEDIEHLRPGDILVFRYKNTHGRSTGGHVMVVMNKPIQDGDAYLISVADSAPSGHSEDTRQRHVSGVGIGTILLKINPKTRQPSAYAWTLNSPWRNNVNFAMARPLDNNWS